MLIAAAAGFGKTTLLTQWLTARTRGSPASSSTRRTRTRGPPYLVHVLQPGQPLPDEGWTYVAQDADRLLELIGRT